MYVIVWWYLGCEHSKCTVVCVSNECLFVQIIFFSFFPWIPVSDGTACGIKHQYAELNFSYSDGSTLVLTKLNLILSSSLHLGITVQDNLSTHTPCFYLFVPLSLGESSHYSLCFKLRLMRSCYGSLLRR